MQTYKVYRNLNNGLLSIMESKTRLVVGHCESVTLEGVTFKVNANQRAKVIAQGVKNVHAFVIGHISALTGFKAYKGRKVQLTIESLSDEPTRPIYYNPFKVAQFVDKVQGVPVYESLKATINEKGHIKAY